MKPRQPLLPTSCELGVRYLIVQGEQAGAQGHSPACASASEMTLECRMSSPITCASRVRSAALLECCSMRTCRHRRRRRGAGQHGELAGWLGRRGAVGARAGTHTLLLALHIHTDATTAPPRPTVPTMKAQSSEFMSSWAAAPSCDRLSK